MFDSRVRIHRRTPPSGSHRCLSATIAMRRLPISRSFAAAGVLLFAAAAAHCRHAPPPSREARPVAVLMQHSVWSGVVTLPLFILYADGRVIYPGEREEGIPTTYREARVDPDSALERFGIDAAFMRLNDRYDLNPDRSDQESVFLLTWSGDSLKQVTVRAGREGMDRFSPEVPDAFSEAYRRMVSFRPANSHPWEPDTLEVAVWPYEYAPDNPPVEWPADWPDLNSPGSRYEKDEFVDEIHLIPLPGAQRARLDRFLARVREKQAVRINGRKWAVSYRLRFPGEARWRPSLENLEM